MSTSSTSVTAGEIMDRSAVLMNDPSKTDYTYDTLAPFLKMALDELSESLIESQSSPTTQTSAAVILPIGLTALYPVDSLNVPHYPADLAEIQEVSERRAGSNEGFLPVKKTEYLESFEPVDRLMYWAWEDQIIKFNSKGATTIREIQLRYLRDFTIGTITPESIVGSMNSRSFLSYKTAAYAALFIGENKERAEVLDAKAEMALERISNINNKGRQQIMTRHRPFRAAFKARGGY